MSSKAWNIASNVLQGVQQFKRDSVQHENDKVQQAVSNAEARAAGQVQLQTISDNASGRRRQLGLEVLQAQKAAMKNTASAQVQAAWNGVTGGSANDILTSVLQEAAAVETDADVELKNLRNQVRNSAASTILGVDSALDKRSYSEPDVLASILGIGKNIIDDYRETNTIT